MAVLRWGEYPAATVEICSLDHLARKLHRLSTEAASEPLIAMLEEVHGHEVAIALAGSEAALTVYGPRGPDGLALEFFSVGVPDRSGFTSFMLLGAHHTELPNAQLVPAATAIRAAGEFLETGHRSALLRWEENAF